MKMLSDNDVCWSIRPLMTFSLMDVLEISLNSEVYSKVYDGIRTNSIAQMIYWELINTHYTSDIEIK